MAIALHVVPVAAGEVGHLNGHVALIHRYRTQFSQAAPLGEVVDVHVEGQTVAQAVDEARVHDEVHATVATHFLGLFAILRDDGRGVLLEQSLGVALVQVFVGTEVLVVGLHAGIGHVLGRESIALNGILVGEAQRTRELIHAVVGLRSHHVVVNLDDLAVLSRNQRGGVVAVAERLILTRAILHQLAANERLRVHGHERLHAVAAVDVEHLSDGAEAVSGIDVATELLVIVQAPAQLVLVVLLPVVVPELRQFVAIGTLCVDDLTEETLLCHVERVQLEEVVAAVLQNHAVQALLLGEVDELPDFVHVHGRRHLDGHVLTVLQCLLGHQEVVYPVGGDVDHVDVGALAEFLIAILAIVDVSWRHGSLLQVAVATLGAFLHMVAERLDFDAGNVGPALHGARSAHAQTDECHAHHVHLRCHQSQCGLLSGRHGRHIRHDGSVHNFVGPVEFSGLGLLCPCVQRQQKRCCQQKQK